jgi:hypothetical protein
MRELTMQNGRVEDAERDADPADHIEYVREVHSR